MPVAEKGNPEIKFSEWMPIGVCDQGDDNKRKAVFFSERDLAIVNAANVNRQNWPDHPEVIKLINRYAKKVAQISDLTTGMARPAVSETRLVGTIMRYNKTPSLNQQSEEGRVQLFEVAYVDRGKKKTWLWKVVGGILLLVLLVLAMILIAEMVSQVYDSRDRTLFCGTKRSSVTYTSHLQQAQQEMEYYLNQRPVGHRNSCYFSRGGVVSLEKQLIACYLSVQTASSGLQPPAGHLFKKVGRCVERICQRDLSHTQAYCKQLKF
ncbi:MAG: hypothetical protein HQM14_11565 [SAR324 cluster bacterium]|nr:hypothetical protein [SAR324 cluster bacterium]